MLGGPWLCSTELIFSFDFIISGIIKHIVVWNSRYLFYLGLSRKRSTIIVLYITYITHIMLFIIFWHYKFFGIVKWMSITEGKEWNLSEHMLIMARTFRKYFYQPDPKQCLDKKSILLWYWKSLQTGARWIYWSGK